MTRNLFVVLLLLLSSWIFAQQIPLKSAFVQIEKQHNVKFNYTEETVAAFWVNEPQLGLSLIQKLEKIQEQVPIGFEIADNYYIIVTKGKSSGNLTFSSAPAYNLEEVTISKYLTSGISKNKNGTYLIKPEKFGILPGLTEPDVLQTMQQIPGIYSADESISNINVRGGTHDQNLFLWNGIRMFQTGHFFGLISAFNPALPNTIGITKNGSSPFYGESVSSVVSIDTSPDNIQKTAFGGGINMISVDFYAKIKTTEKAAFVLSGRRSYTDVAQSLTYQKYYNRMFQNTIVTNVNNSEVIDYKTAEDFYFYDFTAQYQQKIGAKNELVVNGIAIKNQLGVSQQARISDKLQSKYSFLEQQSLGGNVNWKTTWNEKSYTKANVYLSRYILDATNQAIERNNQADQRNAMTDIGIRLEHYYKLSKALALHTGYQFNETGNQNFDEVSDPQLRRDVKTVLRSHTIIGETQYDGAEKKIHFKTGFRLNYLERFGKLLAEPRIQVNYALTKKWILEMLGEMKSQTASQVVDLQQDFLGIEKRRWILADDREVPIQRSKQLSAGLTFKDASWLLSIDNFYKEVKGISGSSQAFQNQLEGIKINGDYKVLGSEILVQRNFTKFYSWVSYSFNRNDYRFKGFEPERFSNNFEIAHSISAAAIYDWKQFKLAFGGKWNSGRPTTLPESFANQQIFYKMPNDSNMQRFLQFNLSASYSWNLPKARWQVSASVLNLFNTSNTINRYYRLNTANNTIESVNTYALERTPNLSLRAYF